MLGLNQANEENKNIDWSLQKHILSNNLASCEEILTSLQHFDCLFQKELYWKVEGKKKVKEVLVETIDIFETLHGLWKKNKPEVAAQTKKILAKMLPLFALYPRKNCQVLCETVLIYYF